MCNMVNIKQVDNGQLTQSKSLVNTGEQSRLPTSNASYRRAINAVKAGSGQPTESLYIVTESRPPPPPPPPTPPRSECPPICKLPIISLTRP